MPRIVLAIVTCLTLASGAWAATEFHVSPDGNDAGSGTAAAPFLTLTKARDSVRALKTRDGQLGEKVTVVIHGGTYWLPEPFELGPQDSGSAAALVTYRAAEGEDVWLSGGIPLQKDRFTPVRDPATRKAIACSAA